MTATDGLQQLPDPTGPCVCAFDSEDRGGGHFELVQECEPACPVHSEHVYDPVLGMWMLRAEVSRERPERPTDPWAAALGQADVEGMQAWTGGAA